MPKILLVEDDRLLAAASKRWLESERHTVDVAATGQEALSWLESTSFDVIVLDWHLPDMKGPDICRQFRASHGTTPVIFLTAMKEIDDKEVGFSVGADDYLTKPFELRELSARIKALLRRPQAITSQSIQIRNISMDTQLLRVLKDGAEIVLSPKEFALLQFFMKHPNQFFTADNLVSRVWQADAEIAPETVRTHLKNLRMKIETAGAPPLIVTVHRLGYKLDVPDSNLN